MDTTGRTVAGEQASGRPGVLNRLGLHRRELRSWAMYDWAASSVQTTIMVAVFPIYFIRVAGAQDDRDTHRQDRIR